MEKMYFDEPKQVVFADPDNEGEWLVGIAYKDEIICACCGGVFKIEDVINSVEEPEKAIFPYADWINLEYEIKGDEPPKGFAEATGLDIAMMNADEYEAEQFGAEAIEAETESEDEVLSDYEFYNFIDLC